MTSAPKLSPDAVLAAALVAVTVPALGAWVGAHTGTRGTVIGTAIGAVLSVLTGWLVLRAVYHARSGIAKVPWERTRPWHLAVAAGAVFVVAMGAITGVEAGVLHKSLSASVTGSRAASDGTGTTLGAVVANHPARPAASSVAPYSASSAPSTPVTVTPTVGGTPGPPSSPVTMTPSASVSTNAPPTGAASPAPAQTQQQGATP